ncbi:MAG: hypothetical protein AAGK22_30680 [Acidobacteriota bacterium]
MAAVSPQSASSNGSLTPPAQVTLGQAERFFALLCDLGFDEAFSRHAQSSRPAIDPTKPVSAAAQVGVTTEAAPTDEGTVTLDLGALFREIGARGAYRRLAAIVFNVHTSHAQLETLPLDALEDAFVPFALRCHGPLRVLLDSVLDWA